MFEFCLSWGFPFGKDFIDLTDEEAAALDEAAENVNAARQKAARG